MAAMLELQSVFTGIAGDGQMTWTSWDGTYIWLVTRTAYGGVKRLWRFRPSDKKLIKPNGTIGDYSNAYVTLAAWGQYSAVVSNGTYVVVSEHNDANSLHVYNCSDMSSYGRIASSSLLTSGMEQGAVSPYNGLVYLPSYNDTTVMAAIFAVNMAALTFTRVYTSTYGASSATNVVCYGQYAYLTCNATSGFTVEKVDLATNTMVWRCAYPGLSRYLAHVKLDTTRDELWGCSPTQFEALRIRNSDGAYLDRNGNVSIWGSSIITGSTDSPMTGAGGLLTSGGYLYAGSAGAQRFVNIRNVSPATDPNTGFGTSAISRSPNYLFNLSPDHLIGTTVYFIINGRFSADWGNTGIAWYDVAGLVPNLTDVSPGLTPQHISLTFDNAVGITGPTLGPKSGNLQVTSATALDSTHIDLGVSIDPCPPTDVLSGTARDTNCGVVAPPTPCPVNRWPP